MKLATILLCVLGVSLLSSVTTQNAAKCDPCVCCQSGQCIEHTDNHCVTCTDGWWGLRCYNPCPATCVECNRNYGSNEDCPVCVNGYYDIICDKPCRNECLTCSGLDQCTTCKDGYYNFDTVTNCTLVASPCLSNCKFCYSSATACAFCEDRHYINPSGNCLPCSSGCVTCSSGAECTECRPYFTGRLCESCVAGKYGVNCDQDCPISCTSCTNQLTCQQCKPGYYSGKSPIGGDLANDCRHSCPDSCYTCNSYTNCTACKSSNYKGDACVDCVDGRYGATCTQYCSEDCWNKVCVRDSGICVACKPGYAGDICDRCEDGKYGYECKFNCSDGCRNNRCGRYNGGACTDGCINDNIQGTNCDACIDEYYNTTCLSPCPVNCLNGICRKEDGTCTNGCKGGYNGPFCDQCEAGKFGENCDKFCPAKCLNQICKREDGTCLSCTKGFFGKNCTDSCSANCASDVCIQGNGTCPGGCLSGYSGDRCCIENSNCEICSSNDVCSKCVTGWHGDACDRLCSVNCNDAGCIKETGNCLGCKAQRYGSKCENECPLNCMYDGVSSRCDAGSGYCVGDCETGYHGAMCDQDCNSNCNNGTCSKDAAACLYGCKQGFAGVSCADVETGDPGSPAALIGGVVAGVVALAVIVILIVVFLRRRRSGNKYEETRHNFQSTSIISNKSEKGRYWEHEPTDSSIRRKEYPEPDEPEEEAEDPDDIPVVDYANNGQLDPAEYGNIGNIRSRIAVEELEQYVSSTPEQEIIDEYKVLPRGLIKSYTAAKLPKNMGRNRYAQVYPYDENRVKLTGGSTDYINASYIDGYNKERAYIASLGPTKAAMADFSIFWDMVWQEKIEKIVMLTNLVENTKMKCHQYWPEAHKTATYGDVTVMNLHEDVSALYIVRNFSVTKDNQKRTVSQVHFTAWPDKGVPDHVTSIVELHNRVNRLTHELGGPVLVHCSAGIGRTGTYIGLDILTEEGEATGHVDIFNGVMAMRKQRINMVQTEEQYVYLHKALVHSLTFDSHPINSSEFQDITAKTSVADFETMYQRLKETMENLTEEEERSKKTSKSYTQYNRNGTDIPGDRYRPRLYKFQALGDNDYINAVFIDSFKTKNRFLAAQSPLPGTVVDFIKLMLQEKCTCVVNLEPETLKTKSLGNYLPPDNETVTHGLFTLSCNKLISPDSYTIRQVTIQQEKSTTETIIHCFQFNAWPGKENVPRDPTTFLRFIKDVKDKAREFVDGDDTPPILLHCLSGAIKCGLFCAVHNAVEKIDCEQEVSVVNIMRQIKVRRRTAIPNKDQLVFCYKAVCAYLDSFDTYSNFELRL